MQSKDVDTTFSDSNTIKQKQGQINRKDIAELYYRLEIKISLF